MQGLVFDYHLVCVRERDKYLMHSPAPLEPLDEQIQHLHRLCKHKRRLRLPPGPVLAFHLPIPPPFCLPQRSGMRGRGLLSAPLSMRGLVPSFLKAAPGAVRGTLVLEGRELRRSREARSGEGRGERSM